MSSEQPSLEHLVAHPAGDSGSPRAHPWLAWSVIAAVAAWLAWHRSEVDPGAKKAVKNELLGAVEDWQARYLVGAANLFQQADNRQFLAAAPVDTGPFEQRLRNVALAGELGSASDAADQLNTVEKEFNNETSDDDRRSADALHRLYGDLVAGKSDLPSLDQSDRDALVTRLGWIGRLALHPAGGPDTAGREVLLADARRTFIRSLVLFAVFGAVALGGLGALVTIVVLLLARPRSRALPPSTLHGGIYAETFAVWMAMYVGLSYAAGALPVERHRFLLAAGVILASIAALAWPLLRGVAWRTVRDDVGLFSGRRPLVELLLGMVTYLAAIPLALVGLMIVLALMAATRGLAGGAGGELNPDHLPYHPIVGWLLKADWWEKMQVVFIAAVMAPLIEETMFRGVLYRHLRDATSRFGYVGSVVASALAVSFVFAAIHPQGWIAIPALMGLALGFTLAREWRGTLVPAMVAHGINNGLLTWILISMS